MDSSPEKEIVKPKLRDVHIFFRSGDFRECQIEESTEPGISNIKVNGATVLLNCIDGSELLIPLAAFNIIEVSSVTPDA